MNPLLPQIITGVTGELLVQLRLFQYGVQAAPPLADSGNDLIGIKGKTFKAIQVKTTSVDGKFKVPTDRDYHILACVVLRGQDTELELDQSTVYLVEKEAINSNTLDHKNLRDFIISKERVNKLFS